MNIKLKKVTYVFLLLIMVIMLSNVSEASSNYWVRENNSWSYYLKNSKICNSWIKINKKWYKFDNLGRMKVGWYFDDKYHGWYYLSMDGSMKTGWIKSGSRWFFLDNTGKMVTGWKKYNGAWYYFDMNFCDGAMRSDSWIDGYDFTKVGIKELFTNPQKYTHFYLDKNGKYIPNIKFEGQTGVFKDDVFIRNDGSIVIGPAFINGKLYVFPEGKLNKGYYSDHLSSNIIYSNNIGEVEFVEPMVLNEKNQMKTQKGDLIQYNDKDETIIILEKGWR